MATVEKAEIKIITANNIGADIEDMLEQARKSEHMHEGGKLALADAAKKVNALTELFIRSVQEGELDLSKLAPEEIEGLVKRWINRCVGLLENLTLMSQNAQLSAAGMVAAYKNAMKAPMKIMEAERKKMEAIKEAIEEQERTGDPDLDGRTISRAMGQHPGDPLADRRKPNGSEPSDVTKTSPEEPIPADISKLSPARKELITQIDNSMNLLATGSPDAEILRTYRKFIVEGGDLRTKDGRELREQAESLLKAKAKSKNGKNR